MASLDALSAKLTMKYTMEVNGKLKFPSWESLCLESNKTNGKMQHKIQRGLYLITTSQMIYLQAEEQLDKD